MYVYFVRPSGACMYHSLIPRPAFHRPAKKKAGLGMRLVCIRVLQRGGGDLGNKGVQKREMLGSPLY